MNFQTGLRNLLGKLINNFNSGFNSQLLVLVDLEKCKSLVTGYIIILHCNYLDHVFFSYKLEHLIDNLRAVSFQKIFADRGSVLLLAELGHRLLPEPDGGVHSVDLLRQVAVGPLLVLQTAGQAAVVLLSGNFTIFSVQLINEHLAYFLNHLFREICQKI